MGRGGWRPGAGRPRGCKVPHGQRSRFAARFPLHVTLRVVADVPSLRRHRPLRIIQRAIERFGHRADFRIIEYSVIGNHIHMIAEASGAEALARGMHRLEVSLAKRLNRHFERRGAFFVERYHSRVSQDPARDAKCALLRAPQPPAPRGAAR
jgi:REP element-mobilizing transposase RayT